MNDVSLTTLFLILFVLILLSGFFSGSETALMALDRYRLRHQADKGNKSAQRTVKLLAKPDQLISLILLGNNFINILITQLATYIGFRLSGEAGVAIATGVLTILLLIFAEVAPKTLGVMRSEMLAHPATLVYYWMLRFPPLAWVVKLINWLAGGVLKILRLKVDTNSSNSGELSTEELRTVVTQTRTLISSHHQDMLLRILDIDNATVEDIMIPRSEIIGIDLDDDWEDIETLISNTSFTRLPVFRTNIDNIQGFIHIRSIMKLMASDNLNKESIQTRLRSPLFIPENTSLPQQLLTFQKERRRHGLVVDEYGDIQGLVVLEEILEEIVGEFTNVTFSSDEVHPQQDGSYIIDGGIHVRELKQLFGWELEKKGPKTLNGLILEYLESIPISGTTMLIHQHPVEVLKVQYNAVQTAKIYPKYEPSAS